MYNKKPFVPFIQVDEEFFGIDFVPNDFVGSDLERKLSARKAVRNIAKMMCKENKPRITQNLENVTKKLPSDRIYTICTEKLNDLVVQNAVTWHTFNQPHSKKNTPF